MIGGISPFFDSGPCLSEHSMAKLYPQRDTIATAELTAGDSHRGST